MQKRSDTAGTDLQSFVGQVHIATVKETEQASRPNSKLEGFIRPQDAWVKLHPRLDHVIDDSRDSFYAGRATADLIADSVRE